MKIYHFIIIFFIWFNTCLAIDQVEILFYNELQADFYDFEPFRNFQENITSDSLITQHIFTGRILQSYTGDIFPLAFLNYVNCDLASPTDIRFNVDNSNLSFQLMAANILNDSLDISPYTIIETDSLKIGIFSIYTPDFAVKYELNPKVRLDPQVFAITRTLAEYLASKTDLIILISNLSKYIDSDMVKGLPIDVVLSSDYQEKTDGLLNNNVKFYSIVSKMQKFGRLKIIYSQGKINYLWSEEPILLSDRDQEKNGTTDAAGD